MKIAILGSGGREHSIGLKLKESRLVESLFFLPGNPGTATIGSNHNFDLNNYDEIYNFLNNSSIDFLVIGPENPLVEGLSDFLRSKDIKVLGPSKAAARLEGSKAYSKDFMKKYNIPTAKYKIFTDFDEAIVHLNSQSFPLVIKASGLAAGKGAVVCFNYEKAKETLKQMMVDKLFSDAGDEVVIEEFLSGEEASIFAISDGKHFKIFASAQDHKQIFDGDKGANTGGMGSYSPAPVVTSDILKEIKDSIISPVFDGMEKEGTPYQGILFVGLMIGDKGANVIEFNCRFGDPETQVILPLYDGDLAELFSKCVNQEFKFNADLPIKNKNAVCLILASGGYPETYEKGKIITGLNELSSSVSLIHGGTKVATDDLVTNGGRVLGIVSVENSLRNAIDSVYKANKLVNFDGKYFRQDIGQKGLKCYS